MLNKMVTKNFVALEEDILIAPQQAFTYGVIVGNTGVNAGSDGRKVIKEGTPLYQSADSLMNRQTVLTVSKQAETDTVAGVLLHRLDVTDGNTNGTLVYRGYIDYLKLDSAVQTAIDALLTAGSFNPTMGYRITFIKGRA